MNGKAKVHGAISVVNAIATGKGSALGISLETNAEVTLHSDDLIQVIINDDLSEDSTLAKECFKIVRKKTSQTSGAKIVIDSNIPIGKGLKSSSAAANAIILASLNAFDMKLPDLDVLNLSVEASKKSNVTITGAFDDAAASLLGGLVVTDNTNNELLSRNVIDKDLSILIHVPEQKNYTKNIVISDSHKFKSYVDSVFNIALDGNYLDAMTLNGMLYSEILKQSNDAAIFALKNHALAAGLSGTGPSVAAICRPGYESQILESWKSLGGNVIFAKINNDKGM
ncbi:MAG: shikimate kinase [Thaumarchaeota archaeon]|nr:shikimate kinase [Nitrososphaerota archaeon]